MACLKCGSEWVTRKGKDMVSCPECCRLQRCKARKQGRLPATLERTCKRCGEAFTAEGSAMSQASYCKPCRPLARNERIQQWKQDVAAGVRQTTPQAKRGSGRPCLKCGKPLRHSQPKYCSRACFFAARNEGRQSWDRTRQLESVWHRGGRWANAPSTKYIGVLNDSMQSVLKCWSNFRRALQRQKPICLQCDNQCKGEGREFCSKRCAFAYREMLPCKQCSRPTPSRRNRPSLCKACAKDAKRESSRNEKQKYGRNHRQRARHHGVRYVPVPVKEIYERDNYTCQICSKKCLPKAMVSKATGKIHPRSPSIDHIVPMCRGGEHVEANLQTACFKCNSLKSSSGGGQLRLTFA